MSASTADLRGSWPFGRSGSTPFDILYGVEEMKAPRVQSQVTHLGDTQQECKPHIQKCLFQCLSCPRCSLSVFKSWNCDIASHCLRRANATSAILKTAGIILKPSSTWNRLSAYPLASWTLPPAHYRGPEALPGHQERHDPVSTFVCLSAWVKAPATQEVVNTHLKQPTFGVVSVSPRS